MSTAPEKDWASLTDEDLALALKEGQMAALDVLVQRHQGRVYAVAYRFTSNREDALDVAQDALIKAYQKIRMWQPQSGFLPWLLRLTANQAIDFLRRKKRRRQEPLDGVPGLEAGMPVSEAAPLGTETRVHAHEIDARVQRALDALSHAQRTVFVMRHYEGLPLADIAQALGCTVGSVKVHLFRALKKLQAELKDLYVP